LLQSISQTYIAPWLFGPAKPAPNPQAAVVETCQAVLGGVQQLQQAITSLQVGQDTNTNTKHFCPRGGQELHNGLWKRKGYGQLLIGIFSKNNLVNILKGQKVAFL